MLNTRWIALALCFFLMGLSSQGVLAQLPDFTGLVERNSAAVVNISTSQKVNATEPQLPDGSKYRKERRLTISFDGSLGKVVEASPAK